MPDYRRLFVTVAATSLALSFVAMAVVAAAPPNPAVPNHPMLTATPSVTPETSLTPTPEFSATLKVKAARTELQVGEQLAVVVDLDVVEGCQYPVFELTLTQQGATTPIFDYIAPTEPTILGGVTMPFTYTLQATRPGLAILQAQTFGERYCGDFWIWRYLYASTGPIFVGTEPHRVWLPLTQRPSLSPLGMSANGERDD